MGAKDLPAHVLAAAFVDNDSVLVSSEQSGHCSLEERNLQGALLSLVPTSTCFAHLERLSDGGVLLSSAAKASWWDRGKLSDAGQVVTAASRDNLVIRRGDELVWQRQGTPIVVGHDLRSVRLSEGGDFMVAVRAAAGLEELIKIDPDGSRNALYSGVEINSYDLDPKGKEVVFSARRESGFDIGIVSAEGGAPKWIAPDPLDEKLVRWAPRGNKITYVIEGFASSTLRTVHLPSSYQLSVSLPQTDVTALAWQPAAERFVIISSSPDQSPRASVMKYSGEEQKVLTAFQKLNRDADQLSGRREAILPPSQLVYGERYPAVILFEGSSPLSWSDTAGLLAESSTVAIVHARENDVEARSEIEKALTALPWIDPSRIVAVAGAQAQPGGRPTLIASSAADTARAVLAALRSPQ